MKSEAQQEKLLKAFSDLYLVAHHGGLIDLSENEALVFIRKLTGAVWFPRLYEYRSQTIAEKQFALREIQKEITKTAKVDLCIPPTTNEQLLEKTDKLKKFCDTLSTCTGLPNWTNVHTREMLAVVLTEKKFEGDPDENN